MRNKNLLYFAILFLLFQSCVVYNKASVPLYKAVNRGNVKVLDRSGRVKKFTNIILIDSVYYGVGRDYISQTQFISDKDAKTVMDSTKVTSIRIKNMRKSKDRTTLLVIGTISVVIITAGIVYLSFLFQGW